MNRRTSLSLLTLLVAVFAAVGAGAAAPSGSAVEPAAVPAGTSTSAPAPACTEEGEAEAVTMAAELVPNAAEPVDAGVEANSYYGICYPNFCEPCMSDADCTDGNTCEFDVQCP
ncbi:MAG: hypothetical protein ACLF0P_06115 [Thermoanaerobaculia bacterium]